MLGRMRMLVIAVGTMVCLSSSPSLAAEPAPASPGAPAAAEPLYLLT
jgi:hypothetical protein